MRAHQQGTTLFTAILILVATGVVIQLWLLTAAMEALMGRKMDTLIPLALGSLALFLLNAGLLRFVYVFERRLQKMNP